MKVFLQTLLFVSIVYFCHVTFLKFPVKCMTTIWYECIYWLWIRVCMNAGATTVEIICIVQSVPITTKVRIPHMTRCTRCNNVITFVSDLRQVGGFLHQYNWPPRYNWNIISFFQHANPLVWMHLLAIFGGRMYILYSMTIRCTNVFSWYFGFNLLMYFLAKIVYENILLMLILHF